MTRPALLLVAGVCFAAGVPMRADESIAYRLMFPEPNHHWMQVEATFPGLPSTPLELRMSRTSPGRYSMHDFAKNVYDVQAAGLDGRRLPVVRADPHGWTVSEHASTVVVRYKVFGDRVDGTYLAVDSTHAHINMPAAILWGRGLDDRPSTVTLVPPAGTAWQVATQLHAGATPFQFSAPNLQYLMDSPVEFGPVSIRRFDVGGRTFRFAAHHTGTASDLDVLVQDVEKIVRVEGAIFGEYPAYEPGTYTFLADYLPYAHGDGMEHRNSTVMTSRGTVRTGRADLLDTIAHEFFHGWNVERIRPRSLEPFDFERANMSGELWLAEGFTQYYGPLTLSRAGLEDVQATAGALGALIQSVMQAPGRAVRSAVEMSEMASFTDGGRTNDETNWSNTYVSYYPFGGAIALGLDLTLRTRSNGRVSLDDFMRAMWREHGRPGGTRQGYVDRPYAAADAERRLAEISGGAVFARDFFNRYIRGRELVDYAALVQPAGFFLRRVFPGRAWWGDVRLELRDGVRVAATPSANTPAYIAGVDVEDALVQLDGQRLTSPDDLMAIIRRHKPGDVVMLELEDRSGTSRVVPVGLVEDPRTELLPVESAGGMPSVAQRAFREAWLGAMKH